MSYTKTAYLPVTPDEAFALVTEPERLRRWKTVSAVVDLRAGGAYRFPSSPATSPPVTTGRSSRVAASCSAEAGRATTSCRPTRPPSP